MLTRIEAIKRFFDVPGKPVTNAELIDFRKKDIKGFDELGELCLKAMTEQATQ